MFLRRMVSATNFHIIRSCKSASNTLDINTTSKAPKAEPLKDVSQPAKPTREEIPQVTSFFTRKGDQGKTFTLTGKILHKDDRIFGAIGATEELLSYLGLAREYAVDSEHDYIHKLKRIQTVLIDISTAISDYDAPNLKRIPALHTKELEEWIEKDSKELPPPEQYIIPGGGVASASLHVARSLCRRAERAVVPLVRDGGLDKEALIYLNRLSDFLWTLSRLAAKLDKRTESIYIPVSDGKTQAQ